MGWGWGFPQSAKGLRAKTEQIPKAEILPQDLGGSARTTPLLACREDGGLAAPTNTDPLPRTYVTQ